MSTKQVEMALHFRNSHKGQFVVIAVNTTLFFFVHESLKRFLPMIHKIISYDEDFPSEHI